MTEIRPARLRSAVVLRVTESACEVRDDDLAAASVGYAPQFPTPHVERVSPGHLVAVATSPAGADVVVWRWYDAVVVGAERDGSIRLWEPAHGEVVAQRRGTTGHCTPGSRVYASAGLPGADWWAAGPVTERPAQAAVELDEVDRLYSDHGLWAAAFGA